MKLTKPIVCLLILFFQVGSAAAGSSRPATFEELDLYVQEQMERSNIPGLAYAIVQDAEIVHLQAFGVADPDGRPMTPQTPMYIGSVGKVFASLAVRQLANSGKLELDAPVIHYLPTFRTADDSAWKQITVRHLLTHTSGFGNLDGNDPAFFDLDATDSEMVQHVAGIHLNRPVGQREEYSNINYLLLGKVIEAASGKPYGRYVEENIFQPLEMLHSYNSLEAAKANGMSRGYRYYFGFPFAVDAIYPQAALAGGGHISSAEDMAHLLIAFTEHGRYHGLSVVNSDGLPHPEDSSSNYNIDWLEKAEIGDLDNTQIHSGGWLNFSAGIAYMSYDRIGVVVIANSYPAQLWNVKDGFDITWDVLRLYTSNAPNALEPRLSTSYLLGDLGLVSMLGFVLFRFKTLQRWSKRGPRAWLSAIVLDMLVPLSLLLVWPVIQLSSPGNINYNPFWCWNRLVFSVPDITWTLVVLICAWLLVGIIKLVLSFVQSKERTVNGTIERLSAAKHTES